MGSLDKAWRWVVRTWLEEGVLRVWVTGLAVSTTVLPSPGAPLALPGLYLLNNFGSTRTSSLMEWAV